MGRGLWLWMNKYIKRDQELLEKYAPKFYKVSQFEFKRGQQWAQDNDIPSFFDVYCKCCELKRVTR